VCPPVRPVCSQAFARIENHYFFNKGFFPLDNSCSTTCTRSGTFPASSCRCAWTPSAHQCTSVQYGAMHHSIAHEWYRTSRQRSSAVCSLVVFLLYSLCKRCGISLCQLDLTLWDPVPPAQGRSDVVCPSAGHGTCTRPGPKQTSRSHHLPPSQSPLPFKVYLGTPTALSAGLRSVSACCRGVRLQHNVGGGVLFKYRVQAVLVHMC